MKSFIRQDLQDLLDIHFLFSRRKPKFRFDLDSIIAFGDKVNYFMLFLVNSQHTHDRNIQKL